MKKHTSINEKMEEYIASGNLSKMKKLMKEFPRHELLKFEYGKMLAETNNKGNLEKAEAIFLKLKDTMPNYVLFELSKIVRTKNDFTKAESYIKEIIKTNYKFSMRDYYELGLIQSYLGKNEEAKSNCYKVLKHNPKHIAAIFRLISIYIEEENYFEIFNLINKIEVESLTKDYYNKYKFVLFLLSMKLNIFYKEYNYRRLGYTEKQLLDYSKYKASRHISEHLNQNDDGEYYSSFNTNVDVKKLMEEVPDMLNEENYVINNILDVYIISYKDIGFDEENLLKVITLPHTKDIITMYPCKNYYRYEKELIKEDKSLTRTR